MTRPPYKLTAGQRKLRRIFHKLVVLLLLGGVAAGLISADRFGFFGKRKPDDLLRYHNRAFYVPKVVDGDTLDVAIADEWQAHPQTRLRLWGVDTPETVKPNSPVQHFGPEASAFTKKQTLGQEVRLELLAHQTRDKYGRVLAYVYLPDGRMLNRVLIAQGFGYADPRFEHPHKADFTRAMKEAQKEGLGLWKNLKNEDLPYYMTPPKKSKR